MDDKKQQDYSELLTSIEQRRRAARDYKFDLLVRKSVSTKPGGAIEVVYRRALADIGLHLAVEVGGNYLEQGFPHAPRMCYRIGAVLETRVFHRQDAKYFGTPVPFIIIRPAASVSNDKSDDIVVYEWKTAGFVDTAQKE